jgi:hypothetical protein
LSNENSTIKDLTTYFQYQSERIDKEKQTILENRPDIGDLRETTILEFLERHLPKRCAAIKGGFIFDYLGNRSKQIDIIIQSDSTLQFKSSLSNTSGKSFNCIEGCYAAVSVKSRLTKDELIDSLNNVSSIPLLKNIHPNPLISNFDNFIKRVPYKVIFAFDGDSIQNISIHLNEYISNNPSPERLPEIIIVNKKYYLWKVGPGGIKDINNKIFFDYGNYIPEYGYPLVGAMALLHLLTDIQKISNLSMASMINFDEYIHGAEIYAKGNLG